MAELPVMAARLNVHVRPSKEQRWDFPLLR